MKKLAVGYALALLITANFPNPAGAALVSASDPVFGPDSLTIDSDTNLAWLDLTETLDLSFNQVQADADLSNTVLSSANFPGANLLLQLMGCTGACGSNAPFFQGYVELDGSTVPIGDPRTGTSFMVLDLAAQTARGGAPGGIGSKDNHSSANGSYLVRNAATDTDADGVDDDVDLCPDTIPEAEVDEDGCSDDQLDLDHDGVLGAGDNCPDTIIPESVPSRSLGVNRFALTDNTDDVFDTTSPKGKGPRRSYTIADTAGCSCTQIIDALGLGKGHTKFGCSISAMDDWVQLVTP